MFLSQNQKLIPRKPTRRLQTVFQDEICALTQTIYNGTDRKLVFESQNEIMRCVLFGDWSVFASKDDDHEYHTSQKYFHDKESAQNVIMQIRSDGVKFGPRKRRDDRVVPDQNYPRQSQLSFKDAQFEETVIDETNFPVFVPFNDGSQTMKNLLRASFFLCSSLLSSVTEMNGVDFDNKIVGWSLSNFEFFACLALIYAQNKYDKDMVNDIVWISLIAMFDSSLWLRKYFTPNFMCKVAPYIAAGHRGVFQWDQEILKGVVTVNGVIKIVAGIDTISYSHFTQTTRTAKVPQAKDKFVDHGLINNMFDRYVCQLDGPGPTSNEGESLLTLSKLNS